MKWWQWGLLAFVVWYLVTDPSGASHLVHHVTGWLGGAAHSGARFLNGVGG